MDASGFRVGACCLLTSMLLFLCPTPIGTTASSARRRWRGILETSKVTPTSGSPPLA